MKRLPGSSSTILRTRRKQADDFVKNVLEAVDEAFIVIDRDYRVLMANHAYAVQARMDMDDILGRHCYEVSHKQQLPCYETGEECTVRKTFETGTGMDERTREKIFGPFYTTKEVGKGTGLGLSIVYGLVKQHGGFVEVASKPGDGSIFKVYLPMIPFPASVLRPAAAPVPAHGTETVLVAEDSPEVLHLASSALQDAGYQVIEAVDGDDALRKYAAHRERIHLLLLDVIMPKKNGREVYDAARSARPDIKVLFISGYTADILDGKRVLAEGHDFLPKPFLPGELVAAVRAALDRKPGERRT